MLMERINFNTPYRYRKALRMMKYADHHGFPIITFIDTPGAFADLKSEELGQVYIQVLSLSCSLWHLKDTLVLH